MGDYKFWLYWLAASLLICFVWAIIIFMRNRVDDEVDELINECKKARQKNIFEE